ncbi:hypothetical protein AB1K83_07595 [Sporosarcina sp. 179-K 3D1 HS]|uniref:hypothetical protein n=1 Tax=Sporosarcina sp. 179-K 3D1 HS TaxID=3232169 RepID=UPI0039A22025
MTTEQLLPSTEKKQGPIETPVKTIFKKFANQRDVSLVYGDPIELGLKKVVPVAKVRYGVGGGSDGTGGEGGGGGFMINPIGVYEITPEDVKFKSTIDWKVLLALTVCTFGLFLVLKMVKK